MHPSTFLQDGQWCSLDSGIQQPSRDDEDSVKSDSTVLMASLDISWASGSLDLTHAGPEPAVDMPVAPSRCPSPTHADDRSKGSIGETCSVLDASEGMCLWPARCLGKQTIQDFSVSHIAKLFFCSRSSTLPAVKLSILWNRTPHEWRRIYLNKSKTNFLKANWSRGRPIRYDAPTFSTISLLSRDFFTKE